MAFPVLVAAIVFVSPATADAFERTLSCHGSGVFACDEGQQPVPVAWRRSCVDLYLNPEFADSIADPTAVQAAVAASVDAWDQVMDSQLRLRLAGQTDERRVGYSNACDDNVNAIIFVPEQWQDSPGAQRNVVALTSVTYEFRTGTILDADIEVNLEFHPWELLEAANPLSSSHDLQGTLTHELGHLLGLDHTLPETFAGPESQSWQSTTMFARTEPGEIFKRTLESDDRAGLLDAYGPDAPSPGPCRAQGPTFQPAARQAPGTECAREPEGCSARHTAPDVAHVLPLAAGLLVLRRRRCRGCP